MNVLLIHGLYDTGSIFKKLVKQLSSHGHRCLVPSLHSIVPRPFSPFQGLIVEPGLPTCTVGRERVRCVREVTF